MVPLAADVREHARDLIIVKYPQGRHIELVGNALHFDGAAQAVQNDAHETLGGTGDPFALDQRRRQTVLAMAVGLMAGDAGRFVRAFAKREGILLLSR